MVEAKYYKDYGHNYMILQCKGQEKEGSYQYKILTSGKIRDILACSVRYINGFAYYYYDISSKTTLDDMYRSKKMSYTEVKNVLLSICRIYETLSGYFMDEAGLVLLPEYIYYDLTDKRCIGLYYPDYAPDEPSVYKPLIDFILDHIDTEDRRLVQCVYQICEMAEEKYFRLEDALQILEGKEEDKENKENIEGIENIVYRDSAHEGSADSGQVYKDQADLSEPYDYAPEKPEAKQTSGQVPAQGTLFYTVFGILSVLGMAGAAAVYTVYELTEHEKIILCGALAVMGVCLVLCLAKISACLKGKRKTPGRADGKILADGRKGSFGREYADAGASSFLPYAENEELPSLDRVVDRDMTLEMAEYIPFSEPYGNGAERARERFQGSLPQDADYGNTIFFDAGSEAGYKLYAMDKKNKNHIDLKKFPCTVGKMAGCVDHVLSDASVSRIHARFDRQGEKILLTDMNSTNGTYKNGLRMQPQETVEIEPGDEIRFGSLNYCYR